VTDPQENTADADAVERHPCPRCGAGAGSPCRSRSGVVAGIYHTNRFKKVPRLAKLLRVPTPADRGPGQVWRPGAAPPAPAAADLPGTDIRIGYALLDPGPGTTVPARRPRRARHRPRADLLGEGQHPGTRAPAVRSSPRTGPADQSPRPALPGHRDRLRDEAPGARRGRADRAGRPADRARPGPGDAGRTLARHLRPRRPRFGTDGCSRSSPQSPRPSARTSARPLSKASTPPARAGPSACRCPAPPSASPRTARSRSRAPRCSPATGATRPPAARRSPRTATSAPATSAASTTRAT
jgi:hypothetical protein